MRQGRRRVRVGRELDETTDFQDDNVKGLVMVRISPYAAK